MLLRILIKLFAIILGLVALNAYCWSIIRASSESIQDYNHWVNIFIRFIFEHIKFIKLFDLLPFSWIISSIGFSCFVIYDYLSNDFFERNIKDEILNCLSYLWKGLLIVLVLSFLFYIIIYFLQLCFLIFITAPYKIGFDKFIFYFKNPELYYNHKKYLYPFRYISILFIYYFFYYEQPENISKKPKIVQWVFYFAKLIRKTLGVWLLLSMFLWVYSIILMWFSVINKPLHHNITLLLFYFDSLVIAFPIWKLYKMYVNRKRALLIKEIKNEILSEINSSNNFE